MTPPLQEAYDQIKAKEARFLRPYHQRIEQEIKRRERRRNGGHIDPRIKRQMYIDLPKFRSYVPLPKQILFCSIHKRETFFKPLGKSRNYPERIDTAIVVKRVEKMLPAITNDIIQGNVKSIFKSLYTSSVAGITKGQAHKQEMATFDTYEV